MKDYLRLLTMDVADVWRIARRRVTLQLFNRGMAVLITACLMVNLIPVGAFAEYKRPKDVLEDQKVRDDVYRPGYDNSPAAVMGTNASQYTIDDNNAILSNGVPVGYVDPEKKEAYRIQPDGSFKKDDRLAKQVFPTQLEERTFSSRSRPAINLRTRRTARRRYNTARLPRSRQRRTE
jgi:hypothetical protein